MHFKGIFCSLSCVTIYLKVMVIYLISSLISFSMTDYPTTGHEGTGTGERQATTRPVHYRANIADPHSHLHLTHIYKATL